MRRDILGFFAWLLIAFSAAALGGYATGTSVADWYQHIAKPAWTPPDWVFGPVWTTLYFLMAVAAWLVWRPAGFAAARGPLILFLVQLGLNALWSVIFFGMQRPDLAAAEVLLLWVMIVLTLVSFWRRSRVAGVLLVPYLIWVSYATALNIEIARINS